MRILFLHEVNYLQKLVFEMHEFPEYLAGKGHDIGFVQFPEGESKEELSRIPFKQRIHGRVAKDSRITLYTPETRSTSTLGRIKSAVTFNHVFRKIVEDFNPDVIVSFSVPTSGWQALRVCRKSNIPYLFRALDVSHKIRRSLFSPLILSAEKYIYSKADWVSTNNPAMANYCISLGARPELVSVNLPPLNLSHFSNASLSRDEMRNQLGIPLNARVVVYMGSFFYFSGLPQLVKDFAKRRKSNSYLLLIGGGEQDQELRSLVKDLDMEEKVLFTGFVSFQALPHYLGVADIAVNPMQSSLVSNAAFPNKVIQYMASGLPVVSTRLSGLELVFGKSKGLTFVADSSMVAAAAIGILDSDEVDTLGAGNLGLVSSSFSMDGALSQFESVLLQLGAHNA